VADDDIDEKNIIATKRADAARLELAVPYLPGVSKPHRAGPA
jgi:hypothetical protein